MARQQPRASRSRTSSSKKKKKPGLYANIQAKRRRIAHGSGETMRRPGSDGAPSDQAFHKAAKTAKPRNKTTRHHRRRRAKSRARRG